MRHDLCTARVRLAGKQLRGVDRERMDALQVRVGVERRQYADEQWKAACAKRDIYNFTTPAAREHMEAGCRCPVTRGHNSCVYEGPCRSFLAQCTWVCLITLHLMLRRQTLSVSGRESCSTLVCTACTASCTCRIGRLQADHQGACGTSESFTASQQQQLSGFRAAQCGCLPAAQTHPAQGWAPQSNRVP